MDSSELIDIIERAGFEPVAYSGRAMYGKKCVSFSTEEGLMSALADMCEIAADEQECAWIIRHAKTDNMGLGTVIYWPKVPWPGGR